MATISDVKTIHATLTSTTVDTALLTQFWDLIQVTNRDGTNPLWLRFDGTDPVANAVGTYIVPVSTTKFFAKTSNLTTGTPGSTTPATACHYVKVLGNGGAYDIEGTALDVNRDPAAAVSTLGLLANGDPMLGLATTTTAQNVRCYSRIPSGFGGVAISKVGIEITAFQTSNVNIAIHRNTGAGRNAAPGTILTSTGSVASPGSNGYVEFSLLATVTPMEGDWLSIAFDGATPPTLRSYGNTNIGSADLYKGRLASKSADYTPTDNPAPTAGNQRVPVIVGIPPT